MVKLVALVTLALVAALSIQVSRTPSDHHRKAHKRSQSPVDPITGAKLNWQTYLFRRTEAFQERAHRLERTPERKVRHRRQKLHVPTARRPVVARPRR